MIPRRAVLLGWVVVLVLSRSLPASATEVVVIADPPFTDVASDDPFATDIRWMLTNDLTTGCNPPSNDRYCPDQPVTRAQMATFLVRMGGHPPGPDAFVDDDGSAFEADIEALAAAGIARGCNPPTNTRYCPDRPVLRAEMAAFLRRALNLPADGDLGFTDVVDPYVEDVSSIAEAAITLGCNPPTNTRFCPDRGVTRAEMAAFLRRASGNPPAPVLPPGAMLERSVTVTNTSGRAEVSFCAGDDRLSVDVIRVVGDAPDAPFGAEFLPFAQEVDVSAGVFDPEIDRWSVTVETDRCATLAMRWTPGVVRPAWPVPEPVVVSPFGMRMHPILGTTRLHAGVDLRAADGSPIGAAVDGEVVRAEWWGGYGNVVDVVARGGMLTRYAHLSRIDVTVGQSVPKGTILGLAGCTGLCTGAHLHFEMRPLDRPIDPVPRIVGRPPVIDPVGQPLD